MRRIEQKPKSFSILPVLLALIIGAAVTYLIKNNHDNNDSSQQNSSRLIKQADDLLSSFIQLQNLNESYAKMLSNKSLDSTGLKSLDSLNVLITNRHVAFRQMLDSLQSNKNAYDKNSYVLLLKITDAYIAALSQSTSINDTRNSVTIGNTNYNFDQGMLSAMQNALHEKQLDVVNLSMNDGSKKDNGINYVQMMKQQDSVISQVIKSQKQKNVNQSDYSDKLKRDYNKLLDEVQTLRAANTTKTITTETTVSKTDLNEQLQLAKADCYLNRADVSKIISSSKQRRNLLEQALQILNSLSQSSNSNTKQEVQQKLNELKTIAANNHD